MTILCASLAACAPAPEPMTGTVSANGTTLYYESRGDGTPIILIEGGNLDLRQWDQQVEAFAQHHRVIRYDVRGFGRSGPYGGEYRALDDLAGLMDALAIDRAHLVGLSLGGRIAIDFALEHPGRVRSMVLAGPGLSGFAWSRTGNEWYSPIAEAAERGDSVNAAEWWLRSPYMTPAMENPMLAKRIRTLALENSRVWAHLDREVRLSPPAALRLGEIKTPVLILIGERDMNDIQRIVADLEQGVPLAKKVVFDGAGHMLNMERPDEFNRRVLGFIGTLESP